MTFAREPNPNPSIPVPEALFRRLQELSSQYESSIEDIVQYAIELHYDDGVASTRLRLLDRLARLEAGLGDASQLQEQIAAEARRLKHQTSTSSTSNPNPTPNPNPTQTIHSD